MGSGTGDDWKLCIAQIAKQGDQAAFARLFDHFAPRIEAYLVRLGLDSGTAEEVAQEVMATVWQKPHLYDPAMASVSTWVYRIARNRRIDVARRMRPEPISPQSPVLTEIIDPSAAADDQLSARNEESIVSIAISQLPETQRQLVHLAFYEGLSHGDIAARTGQPLGTVKSRLRLAFEKLRRSVEELGISGVDG